MYSRSVEKTTITKILFKLFIDEKLSTQELLEKAKPLLKTFPQWVEANRQKRQIYQELLAKHPELKIEVPKELSINDYNWVGTLLICAIARESRELVQLVLEAKADPNIPTRKVGDVYSAISPLFYTIAIKNTDIVKLLIQAKADLDWKLQKDMKVLDFAVMQNHREMIQVLIEAKVNPHQSPAFITAAAAGYRESLQALIDAKVDPNMKNQDETALHRAAYHGHCEIASLLLAAKADPDLQDNDGNTALITAASSSNEKMFHLLIDAKANLNIKNHKGKTALSKATYHNNPEIVQLLLEAKAEPERSASLEASSSRLFKVAGEKEADVQSSSLQAKIT